MGQALQTKGDKRNAILNMLVFNKMGGFGTIEIFSVGAFVILRMNAGWPEKLVRLFDRFLNWEGKLGTPSRDSIDSRQLLVKLLKPNIINEIQSTSYLFSARWMILWRSKYSASGPLLC